jgi:hypothetical protein
MKRSLILLLVALMASMSVSVNSSQKNKSNQKSKSSTKQKNKSHSKSKSHKTLGRAEPIKDAKPPAVNPVLSKARAGMYPFYPEEFNVTTEGKPMMMMT